MNNMNAAGFHDLYRLMALQILQRSIVDPGLDFTGPFYKRISIKENVIEKALLLHNLFAANKNEVITIALFEIPSRRFVAIKSRQLRLFFPRYLQYQINHHLCFIIAKETNQVNVTSDKHTIMVSAAVTATIQQ